MGPDSYRAIAFSRVDINLQRKLTVFNRHSISLSDIAMGQGSTTPLKNIQETSATDGTLDFQDSTYVRTEGFLQYLLPKDDTNSISHRA